MSFDYKSTRWRRLRESVLRAAGYRCQYFARFGKWHEAQTVHHIWPAEDYPQYAWCRWNLVALSNEAHNMTISTGSASSSARTIRTRSEISARPTAARRTVKPKQKKGRRTDRQLTTALFVLRAVQIGLSIADLDRLEYGFVIDLLTESGNDGADYAVLATQEDIDRFCS